MPPQNTKQFILLPPKGIALGDIEPIAGRQRSFFFSLESSRTTRKASPAAKRNRVTTKLKVLDTIEQTGAKLVEMSPDMKSQLETEQPGLRIVPVVYFYPAKARRPELAAGPKISRSAVKIVTKVVSKTDGSPVANAVVVAFTDYKNRTGAEAVTNKKGIAILALGGSQKKVERLYAYNDYGFWSILKQNFTLKSGMTFEAPPIDLGYTDLVRKLYGNQKEGTGKGITVGVIDTGVGPHKDLKVAGGKNLVEGENSKDYKDNGAGHGTHVAGIIASGGTPPKGVRGLASGVKLFSYRVFGKGAKSATNFAIAKALEQAVEDKCDLINMSLGGGPVDEATQSSIAEARAKGCLVLVASGNDGREPVSFPGSDSLAIAISAFGRKGTFPDGTSEFGDIAPPLGKDPKNFIAEFSNIGDQIKLTGPGVGIISTYPGNLFAVMDGTSMACPAVTGAVAILLTQNPSILKMKRNQDRSNAIAKLALKAARSLGFPSQMQGRGWIKV